MIRRVVLTMAAVAVVLFALAAGALYWLLSGDGVRRALEREATSWIGQPVHIGEASVAWLPRVSLRLRDVRVGEPARITLASVELAAPIRGLLSRRIEDAAIVVSKSRVDMPLPFSLPEPANRRTPAAAAAAASIQILSIREITLRDVTIVSRGREIGLSADLSLTGSRLDINRFAANSGGMALEAGGYAELAPRVNVTVEATADALDVDELFALVSAFMGDSAGAPEPRVRPVRIFARVSSPRARAAGVEVRQFHATIVAEGGQLMIDPLTFDAFGGRQDGWLDAHVGEALQVRIGARVANVDVAQLAAFGGAPGSITGRLTGSGRFGATGSDIGSILRSIRGVGQAVIRDGSMRRLDVVRTVVRFLGRAAARDTPGPGERFDEIVGTFALSDRVLRSDDLTVRSPDYDLFARGTLALGATALDARADLVLSEALSAQAGRDLYRYARAGTRIVLPATISGTLARPRIGIDAAAAVRRGTRNEIERRLEGLLDRVKP